MRVRGRHVSLLMLLLLLGGMVGYWLVHSPDPSQHTGRLDEGHSNSELYADVTSPGANTIRDATTAELETSEPLTLEVRDDAGNEVTDFSLYASSDGRSWISVSTDDGRVAQVPTTSVYLMVGARMHMSRLERLSEVQKRRVWSVVLPRLPRVSVGLDNGLNLRMAGVSILVVADPVSLPDPTLRLPLVNNEDTGDFVQHTGVEYILPDSGVLELPDVLPWVEYHVSSADGNELIGRADFTARPGESLMVDLPLGPGPFIRGRVVDEYGSGQEGVNVVAFEEKRNAKGIVTHRVGIGARETNPSGHFLIAVTDQLPGGHSLEFNGTITIIATSQNGAQVKSGQVRVAANRPVTEAGDLVLGAGATLRGQVVRDSAPLDDVPVTLAGKSWPLHVNSDENGFFEFSGVDLSDDTLVLHAGVAPPWQSEDWRADKLRRAVTNRTPITLKVYKYQSATIRFDTDDKLLQASFYYRSLEPNAEDARWQIVGRPVRNEQTLKPGKYELFLAGSAGYTPVQELTLEDQDEVFLKLDWRTPATVNIVVSETATQQAFSIVARTEDRGVLGYGTAKAGAPGTLYLLPGQSYTIAARAPGGTWDDALTYRTNMLSEGESVELILKKEKGGSLTLLPQ